MSNEVLAGASKFGGPVLGSQFCWTISVHPYLDARADIAATRRLNKFVVPWDGVLQRVVMSMALQSGTPVSILGQLFKGDAATSAEFDGVPAASGTAAMLTADLNFVTSPTYGSTAFAGVSAGSESGDQTTLVAAQATLTRNEFIAVELVLDSSTIWPDSITVQMIGYSTGLAVPGSVNDVLVG